MHNVFHIDILVLYTFVLDTDLNPDQPSSSDTAKKTKIEDRIDGKVIL